MATGGSLTEEIDYVKLYNLRPLVFHLYLLPFIPLYGAWLYTWLMIYGVSEYFEAGLIAVAIIGLLQILSGLFCHWNVHVRSFFTCASESNPSKAKIIKVVPTANNGSAELINLHHDKDKQTGKEIIWFNFQKAKYVYDSEEKKRFCPVQFPINKTMGHYQESKGYLDDTMVNQAQAKFGTNELEMTVPDFMELFKERATAPFFVFQVFCVGLWCLDEYWYYSVFTLFMLIAFEATLVQQVQWKLQGSNAGIYKLDITMATVGLALAQINSLDFLCVYLILGRPKNSDVLIPCDMLLLRGSCIVDEAMLTGESVPQMKEPIEGLEAQEVFDMDVHGKLHLLSGGTKVVQHSPPPKTAAGIKASDNGCIAYVLQTGFNTSQGKLLRTILFGVKRVTANNLETFMFILFLLIFAVTAAVYVWVKGTEDPNRNRYKLFLECTLILTSVVPPELPIELSLAVNSSLMALQKLGVYCTEPFRIPFAGKVDVCCFDKTGTLTSDNLVVQGVAGISTKVGGVSPTPVITIGVFLTIDNHVLQGVAGLGKRGVTLTVVDNHVVYYMGSPSQPYIRVELPKMLYLEAAVVLACQKLKRKIKCVYSITSNGAPETLRNIYEKVPDNYDAVYNKMTCQGSRVLALGYKKLGELGNKEMRDLGREEVESQLQFVGFVVIACPLKMDSKNVIKQIQESSHHVTMITGDNPLTACHVAKELRLTKKPIIVLTPPVYNHVNNHVDGDWHWEPADRSFSIPLSPSGGSRELINKYDMCITGEAFSYLTTHPEASKLFDAILPFVRVFARVAPKQKELVITRLKSRGYVTLMCGDGTNDVGALKHAHCGVALLTGAPERLPESGKRSK
ncbi:predicted protein, partial [Nematostella vectensis]